MGQKCAPQISERPVAGGIGARSNAAIAIIYVAGLILSRIKSKRFVLREDRQAIKELNSRYLFLASAISWAGRGICQPIPELKIGSRQIVGAKQGINRIQARPRYSVIRHFRHYTRNTMAVVGRMLMTGRNDDDKRHQASARQ